MIGKRRRRLLYTQCRSKSISLPLEKSNLQGTYSDAKKWFIGILYLRFMFRRKLFEWIFRISALCRDDDVCCRYRKKTTSHIYNRETQPRKMSTARALSTYKFKARRTTTFYKHDKSSVLSLIFTDNRFTSFHIDRVFYRVSQYGYIHRRPRESSKHKAQKRPKSSFGIPVFELNIRLL